MSQLPQLLCNANFINAQQVEATLATMKAEQIDACSALTRLDNVTPITLAETLSKLFNLPVVSLDSFDYQSCCEQLGVSHLIHQHLALPLEITHCQLLIAVADPSNSITEQEFNFMTGLNIKCVLVEVSQLTHAIHSLYGSESANQQYNTKHISSNELEHLVDDVRSKEEGIEQDNSLISRYIHQIILEAVRKKVSDIHFEPYDGWFRIRFRCDGLLIEAHQPPHQIYQRLASRLKILAQLDISERRQPQDGRITFNLTESNIIHIRISTLPTMWGEKIVLRLQNNQVTNLDLTFLGYDSYQRQVFTQALHKPQGLILITGPTGSGKTLSLYSGLTLLNKGSINISTAEDPVEISLPGINQVQIQPQIGFGFSQALRAFLRQDPDVIMVGEIRDKETADIATKAAQTGHLVLATLHTNSSTEAIVRLKNIGIESYNIAASLSLVIAQRLVRRLCPLCKCADTVPANIPQVKGTVYYQASANGCNACNQGYLGRIGIYEMLSITPELTQSILKQDTQAQLDKLAQKQGMKTLNQLGIQKVCEGVTSHAELQRVLVR
ncbi:type IV-A pilus assembly ATPase PilB [Vibrio pectenicida]|uniref:Type IV-A pilus assembly ATPase PilB n=1 Tax=Vibrio pectenicida TaxID=62763 RepID=A0A7Y3ZVX7_9VIBR|nr:ATPase, T2SS/T4P/T4SS family [Vibrio pectenicida]NOH70120.1 type IV-A pilus assembly ATPase PilB [Vibrio pectenicida]